MVLSLVGFGTTSNPFTLHFIQVHADIKSTFEYGTNLT